MLAWPCLRKGLPARTAKDAWSKDKPLTIEEGGTCEAVRKDTWDLTDVSRNFSSTVGKAVCRVSAAVALSGEWATTWEPCRANDRAHWVCAMCVRVLGSCPGVCT